MAIHEIMVLTAPDPFLTDTSYWYDAFSLRKFGSFRAIFKDATERKILIEDDDNSLNSGYNGTEELSQTLAEDFDFGWPEDNSTSDVQPKGTQIGRMFAAKIEDEEGNAFLTIIPYPYVSREVVLKQDDYFVESYGAKRSILIFPLNQVTLEKKGTLTTRDDEYVEKLDANGDPIPSVFNKNASFRVFQVNGRHLDESELFNYPSKEFPPIKCFAEGSLLQTPGGLRAVETLRKGDLLVTHDNNVQPVTWIGQTPLDHEQLCRAPKSQPILIRKGALGSGLPDRDLTVSPQHRILIRSAIARRMFDTDEVLVAAKHLLELPGIETVCPEDGIRYWHILLPEHDLVLSHGAWTESLFVGPYTLRSMNSGTRAELFAAFPDLAQPDYQPRPARRLLTGREGRKLAERHSKNNKPLIAGSDHSSLRATEEEDILAA